MLDISSVAHIVELGIESEDKARLLNVLYGIGPDDSLHILRLSISDEARVKLLNGLAVYGLRPGQAGKIDRHTAGHESPNQSTFPPGREGAISLPAGQSRADRFANRFRLPHLCRLLETTDRKASDREMKRIFPVHKDKERDWDALASLHYKNVVKPLYEAGDKAEALLQTVLFQVFNPRPGGWQWSNRLKRVGQCPHKASYVKWGKVLVSNGLASPGDIRDIGQNWYLAVKDSVGQTIYRFAHPSWALREALRRAGKEGEARKQMRPAK